MHDKAKKGGGCAAVEGRAALKRARLGDVRRLEKLRRKKRFKVKMEMRIICGDHLVGSELFWKG